VVLLVHVLAALAYGAGYIGTNLLTELARRTDDPVMRRQTLHFSGVLDRLNALLARAHPRPYATDHDGELHLHYAKPDAPLLEQLTTTVAMGISQVVVQHGWQRLGVCSAESCDDVYVDTSRNASRRYCSNTCASRSTVAAYRARRKV